MAAETIVIDVEARFRDQTERGLRNSTGRLDGYERSIQRVQGRLDTMGKTRAMAKIDAKDEATSKINRVMYKARDLSHKSYNFTVRAIDMATAPMRGILNMATSLKGIAIAIGTGMAINQTVAKPIGLADSYTSAKIGFETLFKDGERAQKMMDDIDNFAKTTPFKTSGVISNAQKMIAMGWKPDDIIKDLNTIGDAAAATGKGDEGLNRIILALSQIKSKGKLSTEELTRIVNIWLGSYGHSCEESHRKTA